VPTAPSTIPFAPEIAGTAAALRHGPVVSRLRGLAADALPRMFRPEHGLFAFTLRLERDGLALSDVSVRYSAITLIGIAADRKGPWRSKFPDPREICGRLVAWLPQVTSLGDAALIAWATREWDADGRDRAWTKVRHLLDQTSAQPTVEAAWALTAACLEDRVPLDDVRHKVFDALLTTRNPESGLFAHTIGANGTRAHVACFADQVYPVQALAAFAGCAAEPRAIEAAAACARRICDAQGAEGQWWWHYDWRTGSVIEGYPVYAIHQDAMGPMALLALERAGGGDYSDAIARGLTWLEHAPELQGSSLIDDRARMVWRKVARREPRKASRYLQAALTGVHPRLRAPGLNALFPPSAIDFEDRPYHWGWFLYAWGDSAAR
jgi:hypothetical protein